MVPLPRTPSPSLMPGPRGPRGRGGRRGPRCGGRGAPRSCPGPAARGHEVLEPDELHARAAVRLAGGALGLVDLLPALPRDGVGRAFGEELGRALGVAQRRGGELPGVGVLDDPGDGVGRVLLVRPDDAARPALDPAHGVLALVRGVLVVEDPAAGVPDDAAALVPRDPRHGAPAVADRAEHQAAGDDLLLPRRDGLQAAVGARLDAALDAAQAG